MHMANYRYPMPERRSSRVRCPALQRWISDKDCEIRRNTAYCISCNGCPLKEPGCRSCGTPFVAKSPFQLYCTLRCKRNATNSKRLQTRHQWRQKGICIYCGKSPVQEGRSHLGCQACLDMHSQARKVRGTTGKRKDPYGQLPA